MKKLFVVALALLVCSCTATVGRDVSKDMTSIPTGKGVVVFSTAAFDPSSDFTNSTSLHLVEGPSRKVYDKVIVPINSQFNSYDFPNESGKVRSLTLPEGYYYFVPIPNSTYACAIDMPIYRFSVKSDSISYIGNFLLTSGAPALTALGKIERAVHISLSDTPMRRDVDFFLRSNPSLKKYSISENLPEKIENPGYNCSFLNSNFITGIIFSLP
jgi:hypothetical protein